MFTTALSTDTAPAFCEIYTDNFMFYVEYMGISTLSSLMIILLNPSLLNRLLYRTSHSNIPPPPTFQYPYPQYPHNNTSLHPYPLSHLLYHPQLQYTSISIILCTIIPHHNAQYPLLSSNFHIRFTSGPQIRLSPSPLLPVHKFVFLRLHYFRSTN